MKALLSLAVTLLFLGGGVFALSNFTFDKVEVHIDLQKETEGYFMTLTTHEDGMSHIDFSSNMPMEVTTPAGTPLETSREAMTTRIYFDHVLDNEETYSFIVSFKDLDITILDEHILLNKGFVFPQRIDSLMVAIDLPENVYPEIQSHGVACPEDCLCSQGGACTCEDCSTCVTCRLRSGGTATQSPDDIIVQKDHLTLIWTRSLRANERFDISLLIPKESKNQWYLLGIVMVVGVFLGGYLMAKRKKESDVVRVFLNPDEKYVVDFINNNGGEVLQQDIWRAQDVGFSRPKVSRIIADLEERGIIKREPYKKTFKVKLARY